MRYLFLVSCDPPNMSKRIFKSTALVSVELIPHRLHCLSSSSHSPSCNSINIIDVEKDTHRRATYRARAAHIIFWKFVGNHDRRIADPDLGMSDLPIWGRYPHRL